MPSSPRSHNSCSSVFSANRIRRCSGTAAVLGARYSRRSVARRRRICVAVAGCALAPLSTHANGLASDPIGTRPSNPASSTVVPRPLNGSYTTSSSSVSHRMNVCGIVGGNIAMYEHMACAPCPHRRGADRHAGKTSSRSSMGPSTLDASGTHRSTCPRSLIPVLSSRRCLYSSLPLLPPLVDPPPNAT